jgi:ribulose-5-phosphate 4-epimerase/fuculose-1-phosphate aldolase
MNARVGPSDLAPNGPAAISAEILEELALASHILADQGIVDGFGHVSMRHPDRPDIYLLSRSKAPEAVVPSDILQFTLDSELLTPGDHHTFLERFIHGEIYAARPDVIAVVHSHSHSVLPLGVTRVEPLRSVCHMGGFLGVATPVFEIRDVRGAETDLLVRDRELGQALAASLGDHTAVLMRGHGVTVVGISLRQAVFRSVYTEINARLQTQAMQIGPVTYLTEEEGRAAATTNDSQVGRAWDLWRQQAKRAQRGRSLNFVARIFPRLYSLAPNE